MQKVYDLLYNIYGDYLFESNNLLLEATTLSYILASDKPGRGSSANKKTKRRKYQIGKKNAAKILQKLNLRADAPLIPFEKTHSHFLFNEISCGNIILISYKDGSFQVIARDPLQSMNASVNDINSTSLRNTYIRGETRKADYPKGIYTGGLTPLTRSELNLPYGTGYGKYDEDEIGSGKHDPHAYYNLQNFLGAPYTRIQIDKDGNYTELNNQMYAYTTETGNGPRISNNTLLNHWVGYGNGGKLVYGIKDSEVKKDTPAQYYDNSFTKSGKPRKVRVAKTKGREGERDREADIMGAKEKELGGIDKIYIIPRHHLTTNIYTLGREKEFLEHPNKIPAVIFDLNIASYILNQMKDNPDFREDVSRLVNDINQYIHKNESLFQSEFVIIPGNKDNNVANSTMNFHEYVNRYKNDYRYLLNMQTIGDIMFIFKNKNLLKNYESELITPSIAQRTLVPEAKSLLSYMYNKLLENIKLTENETEIDPTATMLTLYYKDLISRCLKAKNVKKLDILYKRYNHYNSLISRKNALINKINLYGSSYEFDEPIIKTVDEGTKELRKLIDEINARGSNTISGPERSQYAKKKKDIIYQMAKLQLKDVAKILEDKSLDPEHINKEIDYIKNEIDVSGLAQKELKFKDLAKKLRDLYIKKNNVEAEILPYCRMRLQNGIKYREIKARIDAGETGLELPEDKGWTDANYRTQKCVRTKDATRSIDNEIENVLEQLYSYQDDYEILELNLASLIGNKTTANIYELFKGTVGLNSLSGSNDSILWRAKYSALSSIIHDTGIGISPILDKVSDSLVLAGIHETDKVIPLNGNLSSDTIMNLIINKKIIYTYNDKIYILSNIKSNSDQYSYNVYQIDIATGKLESSRTSLPAAALEAALNGKKIYAVESESKKYDSQKFYDAYNPQKLSDYFNIVKQIGDAYINTKYGAYKAFTAKTIEEPVLASDDSDMPIF